MGRFSVLRPLSFSICIVVLSWNGRGLESNEKRVVVKAMVNSSKACVVIGQETKLGILNRNLLGEVCSLHLVDGIYFPFVGSSGSICLFGCYGIIVKWILKTLG